MDKEKNQERAIEIFKSHSTKNTVFFSSDNSPFLTENDCRNHAKTLKDKSIDSIERADVMPSEADIDNAEDTDDLDENNEALTAEQLEEQRRKDRQALEAQYAEVVGEEADPEKSDKVLKTAITKALNAKKAESENK